MATSILAVIDAYAQAVRANDMAAIIAAYHDDFVLNYFGAHPLAGRHEGKAATLAVLGEFSRRTNRKLVDIVGVMGGETRGAMITRERLGPDHAPVEVERVLVYRVADGRLAECWVYDADQSLIDRLVGPAPAA